MAIPMVGLTPFFDSTVDETAVDVYAHRCLVFYLHVINNTTTDTFIQMFNAVAADVTVGTTSPQYSFVMPGGTGASNRGAFAEQFAIPLQFTTALSIAVTTGITTNGAPATDGSINIGYLAG